MWLRKTMKEMLDDGSLVGWSIIVFMCWAVLLRIIWEVRI